AALAVVEVESARPAALAHVAAAKPAARGLGLRRHRVAKILDLRGLAGRRPRHDLADDTRRALRVVLVHDPHVEPGHGLAEASGRTDAGRPERETPFHRAVPLQHLHPQPPLHTPA